MTRAARILFAILIVATAGAFFAAQRLKNQPAVIQVKHFTDAFSPNGDGRREYFNLNFKLKRSTKVTVEIVDADGNRVATLAENRAASKYRPIRLRWNGRDDTGQVVRQGRYKLKFVLPEEGRSVVWPSSFSLLTVPPRPKVVRVGPGGVAEGSGPAILPSTDRRPVEAVLQLGGWRPTARVVRTSPGPAEVVRELQVDVTEEARSGTQIGGRYRAVRGRTRWDGRLADGTRAPAGSYVIQVCIRNQAAVEGCGPTAGRDGLPVPEPSGRFRGRGGVTVRDVAVQPNPVPVGGGRRLTFFVDARGKQYRWSLRRIGSSRPVSSGVSRKPVLKVKPGSTRSAGYRLTVSVGSRRTEVPAMTNDTKPQKVLVVLPAITWQGLNPLDDDGDGLVNVLEGRGASNAKGVRSVRILNGMPAAFDADVQPVLEWLTRHRKRYELTTDLALAQQKDAKDSSSGPQLEGHRGVLLVGEARWTTRATARRLQEFVKRGGTAAVLNPAALHRTVDLDTRRNVLRDPGSFDPDDVFGITSRGGVRLDGPPQSDLDEIGLFEGTDGKFDGYPVGWPAESLGDGKRVATAVDRRDRVLIAGVRLDKGLVIRTGLPMFAARLRTDPDTSELMSSTWRHLSR